MQITETDHFRTFLLIMFLLVLSKYKANGASSFLYVLTENQADNAVLPLVKDKSGNIPIPHGKVWLGGRNDFEIFC